MVKERAKLVKRNHEKSVTLALLAEIMEAEERKKEGGVDYDKSRDKKKRDNDNIKKRY